MSILFRLTRRGLVRTTSSLVASPALSSIASVAAAPQAEFYAVATPGIINAGGGILVLGGLVGFTNADGSIARGQINWGAEIRFGDTDRDIERTIHAEIKRFIIDELQGTIGVTVTPADIELHTVGLQARTV